MDIAPAEPIVIYRVQNDTGPDETFVVRRPVVDSDTGKLLRYDRVDISDFTCSLVIRSLTTETVTNSLHQTLAIDDGPNGVCRYRFQAGDLPDDGGDYDCDLRFQGGTGRETYYGKVIIKTRAETA